MKVSQFAFSRRSLGIAAALIGTLSLAIGAHAALSLRALDAAKAVSTDQGADTVKKGARLALVIGNGHYPDAAEPLSQPINDARALTDTLRRDGFDVDVVEASRRNPYERRFRTFSHGLAPFNVPDNALILSSALPGKVAEDSKAANSVLVTELLSHLTAKSVGVESVFNKTRVAITRASDGEQVPSVSSSLLEDIRFGNDSAGS